MVDSQPRLPLECLRLILQHLSDANDISTLTSMLLVDQQMFAEAASILYNNPFRFFNQVENSKSFIHLIRILSLSTTASTASNDCRLFRFLEELSKADKEHAFLLSPWTKVAPTRDYGQYVRHIHLSKAALIPAMEFHYLLIQNRPTLFGQASRSYTFRQFMAELTRALVSPISAQLKSFTIPLWDMEWYLDSLLRTTECFYSKLDGKVETKCTAIEQIDLARYLPPLDNPRQLDKFSITHFLAHADETNLEYVESIDIPLDTRPDILNEIKDAQPFLHRCRRLDHIELPIFSPEMFAWAVRERNSLQMDLDNNGSVGYRNTRLESPLVLKKIRSPQPPLNTLIRPTSIKLLGLNHLNSRSVDDALFAFGDSLRELCILHEMSSRAHRLERDDWAYDLAIDQNWVDRLRCLRRIEISFRGSFRAWLHPEAISRLQLTELNITQTFYRGSTFPPELGESLVRPMHITSLKKLVLHGLASVNFHPDTLQSTKELETLELAMGRRLNLSENLFEPIPSVLLRQQDVLRNASWDWHLPHLKELTLSETFAAHFKFRMLRGCPSLRELTLHVPSARILSVEEMEECEANGIKDSTRAEGASGTGILQVDEKQVGVSTLTSLVLEGPWVISKEAWQVIARTVAPNVFFLSATGCSGCDPREWIEVTREMVCLRLAFGGAVDQENGSADDLREEYENEPVGKDYIIYRMDLGFYRVSRRSLGVCPD